MLDKPKAKPLGFGRCFLNLNSCTSSYEGTSVMPLCHQIWTFEVQNNSDNHNKILPVYKKSQKRYVVVQWQLHFLLLCSLLNKWPNNFIWSFCKLCLYLGDLLSNVLTTSPIALELRRILTQRGCHYKILMWMHNIIKTKKTRIKNFSDSFWRSSTCLKNHYT